MDLLRELFEQQNQLLNHFFQSIDLAEVERVFNALLACKGTVILTGVGKSGLIAEKMAATFTSTGTRAIFLCPSHAMHGDVGVVTRGDILIAISKSGQSQELLDLLPYAKKKEATTIAMVSTPDSRLEKACSIAVHLPVLRELCPFNLAPTTSAASQLIFGDILAVALMRKKQFSAADFALNHPAGFLGKKMTLTVSDLMLKEEAVPLSYPTDKLADMLHELSAKKCGCLLIVGEQLRFLGIFTDGDLRRAIQAQGAKALDRTLGELMTATSVKWIGADRMAIDAVRTMEEDPTRRVTVLPVLESGKAVGLIRMHDIVQAGLH